MGEAVGVDWACERGVLYRGCSYCAWQEREGGCASDIVCPHRADSFPNLCVCLSPSPNLPSPLQLVFNRTVTLKEDPGKM